MMTEREMKAIARYTAEALKERVRPFDEFLTMEQAAVMLGCAVRTLRSNTSKVPHHKAFKKIVFSRRELEEYIMSR